MNHPRAQLLHHNLDRAIIHFDGASQNSYTSGNPHPSCPTCSFGLFQCLSANKISKAWYPGHVWSYEFIIERTEDGRTLNFLPIVDEFSRIALSLSYRRARTGLHVIRTMETLLPVWGAMDCLRSGNGSEFVAHQVKKWLLEHGIGTHYIDSGSAWKNPFIESINSIFRTTFVNRRYTLTLAETKALTR